MRWIYSLAFSLVISGCGGTIRLQKLPVPKRTKPIHIQYMYVDRNTTQLGSKYFEAMVGGLTARQTQLDKCIYTLNRHNDLVGKLNGNR